MVLMPGFQSTRLVTEGALEPFFFLYTDDSIQGNPETCKQSNAMLNYEVKNIIVQLHNHGGDIWDRIDIPVTVDALSTCFRNEISYCPSFVQSRIFTHPHGSSLSKFRVKLAD